MHYFFVKFTYQELLKNIQEDFLIDAERTPIYWLQGYDSIEKMKNLN